MSKSKTLEETYKKLTQREHILLKFKGNFNYLNS